MTYRFILPLCIVIAINASGCVNKSPQPQLPNPAPAAQATRPAELSPAVKEPQAASPVILAFGDGLTYGAGVKDPNDSYPSQLAKMTGYKVINAGIRWETTSKGLARLPAVLDEHKPDIIVLCQGGNDFLKGLSQQETIENIGRMIEIAKDRGCTVILIGVPKPTFKVKMPQLYQDIADKYGVIYDGQILADIMSDKSLKSGLISLNQQGNKKLAERIAEMIRQGTKGQKY